MENDVYKCGSMRSDGLFVPRTDDMTTVEMLKESEIGILGNRLHRFTESKGYSSLQDVEPKIERIPSAG
jgi:hypothetical protein